MKKSLNPKAVVAIVGVVVLLFVAAGIGVLVQRATTSPTMPETQQPAEVSTATKLLQEGKIDESVTYIQEEVQKTTTPDDTKYLLYTQLGAVHYEKGEYQKALDAYNAAAAITETASIMQSIGSMWLQIGDKKQAVEYYKKSIALIPQDSPTRDDEIQVIELQIKGLEEQ